MTKIKPEFSPYSLKRLNGCHPLLQELMNDAINRFDFTILCGHRNKISQNMLYRNNRSKVYWPNSKHNVKPSEAIDIAPFPINWHDRERFIYLAGIILGIAYKKRIPIRWGGDWDNDTEVKDNKFDDLGHYELVLP